MSKELKKIKAKIKTRLIILEMTQAELAKQVLVAPSVISELLKYGKGSDYVKEKVADVLGIDNPWREIQITLLNKGMKMNYLKIREDGIYLNGQKLNGVQAFKTKSTAESSHATVYLKLLAKLV